MATDNLSEQVRREEASHVARSLQYIRWSLVMIEIMIREQEQKLIASDLPVDTDTNSTFYLDMA